MVPSKSKQRMQDGAVSGSRGVEEGAVRLWVNGRCTGLDFIEQTEKRGVPLNSV